MFCPAVSPVSRFEGFESSNLRLSRSLRATAYHPFRCHPFHHPMRGGRHARDFPHTRIAIEIAVTAGDRQSRQGRPSQPARHRSWSTSRPHESQDQGAKFSWKRSITHRLTLCRPRSWLHAPGRTLGGPQQRRAAWAWPPCRRRMMELSRYVSSRGDFNARFAFPVIGVSGTQRPGGRRG